MSACHACGAEIPRVERIGRRDTCLRCGGDLHCCRNCRFYAPGMHNDCSENQAERVTDKVRGNFCEYFALPEGARPAAAGPPAAAPRTQLDNLFRKKSP